MREQRKICKNPAELKDLLLLLLLLCLASHSSSFLSPGGRPGIFPNQTLAQEKQGKNQPYPEHCAGKKLFSSSSSSWKNMKSRKTGEDIFYHSTDRERISFRLDLFKDDTAQTFLLLLLLVYFRQHHHAPLYR